MIKFEEVIVEQVHTDLMLYKSMDNKPSNHCLPAYRVVQIGPWVALVVPPVAFASAWVVDISIEAHHSSLASMLVSFSF